MQSLKMTAAKGLIASVATIALTLALSLQPQAERPSVAVSNPAPKAAVPNRQPAMPVLANNNHDAVLARLAMLEQQLATLAERLPAEAEAESLDEDALTLVLGQAVAELDARHREAPASGAGESQAEAELWASAAQAEAGSGFRVDEVICRSSRCLVHVAGVEADSVQRFSAGVPWDSAIEFHPGSVDGRSGRLIVERLPSLLEPAEA